MINISKPLGLHILCGVFFCVFAACATLSETQCQSVNWQQLGNADGNGGFPQQRIAQHSKACSKHKLPIDEKAYLIGWRNGITRYCTAQNGFSQGTNGRRYQNSCPTDIAPPFLEAYLVTYTLYKAKKEVERLEFNIDLAVDQIAKLSKSEDANDLAKLKKARDQLRFEKNGLSSARHREEKAERAVFNYLKAHPEIRFS